MNATTTRQHIQTPPSGYRVSRCVPCAMAFTWKGGTARPACPDCGAPMFTTTRRLRVGFWLLEGDDLARAERLPGGLAGEATAERVYAERMDALAARLEADVAAGRAELDPVTGITWELRDYGRGSGHRIGQIEEEAARARAKAEKLERRLAKLGGELER